MEVDSKVGVTVSDSLEIPSAVARVWRYRSPLTRESETSSVYWLFCGTLSQGFIDGSVTTRKPLDIENSQFSASLTLLFSVGGDQFESVGHRVSD